MHVKAHVIVRVHMIIRMLWHQFTMKCAYCNNNAHGIAPTMIILHTEECMSWQQNACYSARLGDSVHGRLRGVRTLIKCVRRARDQWETENGMKASVRPWNQGNGKTCLQQPDKGYHWLVKGQVSVCLDSKCSSLFLRMLEGLCILKMSQNYSGWLLCVSTS